MHLEPFIMNRKCRQWKEVDYAGKYEGISWGDINQNTAAQNSEFTQNFKQTEF